MTSPIEIYDTTLRDGSQGQGVSFSVADKLRIAERLDDFGVHYIEGGWPGSNPKDIEFFDEAKRRRFTHAKLAAFGSTRRKGIRADARRSGPPARRRRNARRHDLRQDLAAARARGASDDARREPGDDRGHDPLPEAAGPLRRLRRRARVRRIQGRSRVRAGDSGGRRTRRRGHRRPVRHEWRIDSRRNRRDHARQPRAASGSGSAFTRTTTSAWALPMRWLRSTPAPPTCRGLSTATASGSATATSRR